jgi:phenylalanyl-tRNA synthetase beta chain
MPIVEMPIRPLLRCVNRDDQAALTAEQIAGHLPAMGCGVEEFAETTQYACQLCGKIVDRTAAQGPPVNCSNCGVDYREQPDALDDLGTNQVIRLELLPTRPDIYDPGGMARYVRSYLELQTGLIEYSVAPPKIAVQVDPHLSDERSYRPYISCAVIRNVALDNELIKLLMNLQEDLHWALGRDRKLASIGVYDLDTLRGETFHYDAVAPDALRFVPLGFPPDDAASGLTLRGILEQHKTGQAYAHLLQHLDAYPLLRDAEGTVLSMPPIINSESTRVTMNSRQFFVDVTGLSQRSVDRALNVMVTSLQELMPAIQIEAVTIDAPAGRRVTPDLAPTRMDISVKDASKTIGLRLRATQLEQLLKRMGHGVGTTENDSLTVAVPAYRNDVMHPIDLIEDAAIAYGYDRLTPRLVPTFTVGTPQQVEEQSAVARRVLTGLGFHQVMTLVLTSEPAAFERWRLEPDPRAVRIDNPISVEQTICRVSLLPGLLETLAINKQYDLPQHLFEVGDCCFCDETAETGAREERFVAAAMIGTHMGYADIRAVADAFAHEMNAELEVRPTEHPSYVAGRVAALYGADRSGPRPRAAESCGTGFQPVNGPRPRAAERIGTMGEVHPEVLENYGLKHPVSVLELSLERLLS